MGFPKRLDLDSIYLIRVVLVGFMSLAIFPYLCRSASCGK